MNKLTLLCVVGARPNFMKVAPLIHQLRRDPHFNALLVHTGQHYDEQLSGRFFEDLELPPPDHYLGVGSGTHAQQTAEVLKRFEPILLSEHADGVIVVGDVNSTLAAALAAAKLRIPVFHVEAGLRSYDRAMPEEINRVVTDAISDVLLISEESGMRNLFMEGTPGHRMHFVGNLMIDSLRRNRARARKSDILSRLGLGSEPFGLVTLHRPSNVDGAGTFDEILEALAEISATLPLVFPVHPRTRAQIGLDTSRVHGRIMLVDPLGYLDFLCLMSSSSMVLTDSGGIQEETTALGIPCLTLRNNTERPVTIELGTNTLAGTRKSTILAAWEQAQTRSSAGKIPPLWDGETAGRCLTVIQNFFHIPNHCAEEHLVAAAAQS